MVTMILYITGPSGAGKSTLATTWVASQAREMALIDGDHITSWLRRGDTSAVNSVAFAEAPTEHKAGLDGITGEIYAAAARIYDARGIGVVIGQLCGYNPPSPWRRGWERLDDRQI